MIETPIEAERLEKAELWRDEESGDYFFRLEYLFEDNDEQFKIILPKVETGIPLIQLFVESVVPRRGKRSDWLIFTCDEGHSIYPDKDGNNMYREDVK